jgi:hypothetical protein
MSVTIPCSDVETTLPGWLALVGEALCKQGWRLAFVSLVPLSATRQLPLAPGTRGGRYKFLLGAAATGIVIQDVACIAVPPGSTKCPRRLVVHLPAPAPTRAALAVALACARGLPPWREVQGPLPHRVCVSLRVPVRACLERAVAAHPGSTITGWVRLLLLVASAKRA